MCVGVWLCVCVCVCGCVAVSACICVCPCVCFCTPPHVYVWFCFEDLSLSCSARASLTPLHDCGGGGRWPCPATGRTLRIAMHTGRRRCCGRLAQAAWPCSTNSCHTAPTWMSVLCVVACVYVCVCVCVCLCACLCVCVCVCVCVIGSIPPCLSSTHTHDCENNLQPALLFALSLCLCGENQNRAWLCVLKGCVRVRVVTASLCSVLSTPEDD